MRLQRPNFGFHLLFMSFPLEFLSFKVSWSYYLGDLGVLRRGPGIFFKNYIFEISAFQRKRSGMSQRKRSGMSQLYLSEGYHISNVYFCPLLSLGLLMGSISSPAPCTVHSSIGCQRWIDHWFSQYS